MKTYNDIKPGDSVTCLVHGGLKLVNGHAVPERVPVSGRALFQGPMGWVIQRRGCGMPAIAGPDNFVSMRTKRRS